MLMEHAAQYQRYRAPQEDGQTLVDPPLSHLVDVVAQSRRQMAAIRCDLQGRPLTELAAGARRGLVERAIAYTSQYSDLAGGLRASDAAVVLSGHQPQLYHPGVWYKNFVLGRLAQQVQGVGIHLLIDSDLCRAVSIRVPAGTIDRPHVENVAYDRPMVEVPYEERPVRDEATFASFPPRAAAAIRALVRDPLVESLWSSSGVWDGPPNSLGGRLARARHAQEQSWGNPTLELPQSVVCQLPEFSWFVAHVLAHLPRFWTAHNESLADYRRGHRLRNRAHPVPDLAEDDLWLEAPFWMWSSDDPRRRPLFARQRGDELLITDRKHPPVALALSADRDAGQAVDHLLTLAHQGIKIRTRALATTLFARLLLGDLFVHGIGGAKYDQVTDQMARRFFGFPLPQFATVSATLRLPIQRLPDQRADPRQLRQRLRELRFHPERYIERCTTGSADGLSNAAQAIEQKRRWIATAKTPDNARQRHRAIAAANEALQPCVAPLRRRLEAELAESENGARASAMLTAREYSFCLFPREHLARLLLDSAP